jgi:hypothetical protein
MGVSAATVQHVQAQGQLVNVPVNYLKAIRNVHGTALPLNSCVATVDYGTDVAYVKLFTVFTDSLGYVPYLAPLLAQPSIERRRCAREFKFYVNAEGQCSGDEVFKLKQINTDHGNACFVDPYIAKTCYFDSYPSVEAVPIVLDTEIRMSTSAELLAASSYQDYVDRLTPTGAVGKLYLRIRQYTEADCRPFSLQTVGLYRYALLPTQTASAPCLWFRRVAVEAGTKAALIHEFVVPEDLAQLTQACSFPKAAEPVKIQEAFFGLCQNGYIVDYVHDKATCKQVVLNLQDTLLSLQK